MTKEDAKKIIELEKEGDIGEVMDLIMQECDVENIPEDDLDEIDRRFRAFMG